MTTILSPIMWTMAWFESLPEWLQALLAIIGMIALGVLVYWVLSRDATEEPKKEEK